MKTSTVVLIGGGVGLAAYWYFFMRPCVGCAGKINKALDGALAGAAPVSPARTFQRDPGIGDGRSQSVTASLPSAPAAPAAGAPGGGNGRLGVSPDTAARSPVLSAGVTKLKRSPYQSPPIIPEPGPRDGHGPIYGAQPF